MDDEFLVNCPFCGEEVTIYIEPDIRGSLVLKFGFAPAMD